jgi:uncharacterized protein (TIGR02246 family)
MNLRRFFLIVSTVVAACLASSCSSTQTRLRPTDVDAINASVHRLADAVDAKNVNGIMKYYAPDENLVVFDVVPPRQYVGAAAFRKDWEETLANYPSGVHMEVTDWKVETDGDFAYGYGFVRLTGPSKDGKPQDSTVRVTDVYKKINGEWLVVHEHVSFPVDPATGQADMQSKP